MKKILTMFLLLITCFSLASCNKKQNTPGGGDQPGGDPEPPASEALGFKVHYQRPDADYTPWGLWIWADGAEGQLYEFTGKDDFGAVAQFEFKDFPQGTKNGKVGFIVRKLADWEKDVEEDRFMDFTYMDLDSIGYYHVYLKSGDRNIYSTADGKQTDIIQSFGFIYSKTINTIYLRFRTNNPYESFEIKENEQVLVSDKTVKTDEHVTDVTNKVVEYSFGNNLPDVTHKFTLSVVFKESKKTATRTAEMGALYATKAFSDAYTFDGDLGAIYTKNATTFRVWSPVSTSVKLRVYDFGTPKSLGGDDTHTDYPMTKGIKGTWECTVNSDCEGKYYTYIVSNATYTNEEVVDPYAKSTGLNGLRGMVVDFAKTNPEGWDSVTVHNIPSTSLTVYETHIADLTSSATWKGTAANAKKYKGFYEAGTTYTKGDITVSTGFDHIKELGVNAVQILPFFDQANDERADKVEFNWGYNPLNYNALEGCYSSDPTDGYVKIKEFKELVKAYNEAGINIIMDVVYNHVNGLEKSNFDILMPQYYFRYSGTTPSNGSGCGNETASEMPMFRKFMIDSTEFWASEYKLGGFRFDLMGVHDVETMNQLTKNLHETVNSAITVYGEPWAGGNIALGAGNTAANQNALDYFEGYGCFNDKMRDALIKGGLSGKDEQGWITNSSKVSLADVSEIKLGIVGGILPGAKLDPTKCINYVTCHDNYTLHDRIAAAGIEDPVTIKKMAMLSNSVVFTSQGITFMLAGEEFLRTKDGNSNSYNATYEVNELNYELKVNNLDMFKNYQKLISLKQNANLFGKTADSVKGIEVKTNKTGSMIYYDVVDTVNHVSYRIIHSNGVKAEDKKVDLAGYTLYLDTLNSNDLVLSNSTQVSEYQTIIAYKNLTE